MEEHVSPITQWFNHIFAPIALSLLHALHIQPADYDTPIPEYVVMSLIVLVVCTILALIVRARLSVERPGPLQQERRARTISARVVDWKSKPLYSLPPHDAFPSHFFRADGALPSPRAAPPPPRLPPPLPQMRRDAPHRAGVLHYRGAICPRPPLR